jgi:uncharacterized protein (DUF779 family)
MEADPAPGVSATESAVAEIGRLKAEHGPLMLFQSGGCCDGSSPMRFHDGKRWWIASATWQDESARHPIPKEYLP